jgi:hypothetical protein
MAYTKNPRGRRKPVTIACRLTERDKKSFYEKARMEGKTPQEKLEELVKSYLGIVCTVSLEESCKLFGSEHCTNECPFNEMVPQMYEKET